jgi:DNA-binding LytR/AlgR family response regulator
MMLRALIVEDEKPAADHLVKMLRKSEHQVSVLRVVGSVSLAVEWFRTNPLPDIIFLDIQLADGLSFEIFNQVKIECPVIFTTAFEEYAIKAFKMNSIDYLLKPVGLGELNFAIGKYKGQTLDPLNSVLSNKVEMLMQLLAHPYKSRFVVNIGPRIKSIETAHIRYFYSLEKSTFLFDDSGKSYDINYSLDQLESQLDPKKFFRISRKHIVQIEAIQEIHTYSNSCLKLVMKASDDDQIMVSRRKMHAFKEWLEK